MVNLYKTSIDIKDTRPDFKPIFVQYDNAQLHVELLDNGQPYDLSNVNRVEFTHVRSDKAVIIDSGEIVTIDDGKKIISYTYRGSEMDSLGTVKTSLATFDIDNKKVSSHSFNVAIVRDLRDEIFEPSQPSFGKLQTLIDDVEDLKLNGGGGSGRDGKDGADGYTPIKGIDYFDGKDGSDANVTSENVITALGFTPVKQSDVGNVENLETTNKTIVSAINEVKNYANNGKSEIVTAVIGKGGTATINDTFSSLASAISNIPMGKKMRASTFGTTNQLYIRTLDFKPSIVLIRGIDLTENHFCFKMYVNSPIENPNTKGFNSIQIVASQYTAGQPFSTNVHYDFSLVTYVNGFSCDLLEHSYSGLWVAVE